MNKIFNFLKSKSSLLYRSVFIVLVFIFICNIATADESNAKNAFEKGCEAYKNNDIQKAVQFFNEAAIKYESPELYYNLGNCNFKLNKLPDAILYYERALKLAPGDEDVDYNLKLANGQIVDKIDTLPSLEIEKWWDNFKFGKGANYWGWLSIAFIFIGFIFFTLFKIVQLITIRRISFYLGCLLIILSLASLYFAYQNKTYHTNEDSAIIFAPKVDVKSAPSETGTNVFVLHEGTKVTILENSDAWLEIKISNGNRGWMLKKNCEVI